MIGDNVSFMSSPQCLHHSMIDGDMARLLIDNYFLDFNVQVM